MLAFALAASLALLPGDPPASAPAPLPFDAVTIDARSNFEAVGVADFDKDGDLDLASGDSWFAAPDWTRHPIGAVGAADGYRLDFADVPLDVNGDSWIDIVSCSWHRRAVVWRENPGAAHEEIAQWPAWTEHVVDEPGNMETALAVDVDGDGRLDFVPDVTDKVVWYRVENGTLVRHDVSATIGGHGIGVGDVNGDGKNDFVKPGGWLAAPDWEFHPFPADFALGHLGIAIVVRDFDGDGDADLFAANGHDYGTCWLEQTADPAHRFVKHDVDHDWSMGHSLALADLDGDGVPEIVTGKRFHAHDNDPGVGDPLVIFDYAFDRATRAFRRTTIHEGGAIGAGLTLTAVDLDKDGDVDLVCPGKSGLYLLMNSRKPGLR